MEVFLWGNDGKEILTAQKSVCSAAKRSAGINAGKNAARRLVLRPKNVRRHARHLVLRLVRLSLAVRRRSAAVTKAEGAAFGSSY